MKLNFSTFTLTCLMAIVGSLTVRTATSADAMASPSPSSTAWERPNPFHGIVFSIDKTARKFTTQSKEKKMRFFALTAKSRITKDNKPALFDDLKAGEEVRGSALKRGEGRFDVVSLEIGKIDESAKTAPIPSPAATVAGKKQSKLHTE